MIIINTFNNSTIEYNVGVLSYDDTKTLMYAPEKTLFPYKELIEILKNYGFINQKIVLVYPKYEPRATEILFALTHLKNDLFIDEERYDLTLAAAIPLFNENQIVNDIMNNLYKYMYSGQIYIMKHSDLSIRNIISYESYRRICAKERKTISKNNNVVVREEVFSQEYYSFWKKYYLKRFGNTVDDSYFSIFKLIFENNEQFKLYCYSMNNQVIAYNVCFYSYENKIIYDMVFPWIESKNIYRIGIFSIIVNLSTAYNMGWGYSLCYGKYKYKDSIMKWL